MADLVVGMAKSVVDGALAKAQAAIEEEGKLRQSAAQNLVFITGEFQMMRSFLNVADIDQLENPVVRTWVRQIRDLAYDVEDCIEFVVHLDKKNRWWLHLLTPLRWLTTCVGVEVPPLPLDKAVEELVRLKAMVEDVSSRNTRYNLISHSVSKPTATAAQNNQKQLSLSSGEAVGGATAFNRLFEAAFKTAQKGRHWHLTQLLPKKDQSLGVISLWATATGAGGDLGMTSTTWNAYIDDDTRNNFSCRAWVKVMHPFNPHEFIRSLTTRFYTSMPCKEDKEPQTPVGAQVLMKMDAAGGDHYLKDFGRFVMQNRFLVVLEDLSTMAEWEDIRSFLPDKNNGSCIILCTQQFEVASLSVGHPYQVLHLNQLSADHSVYAFFSKGFHDDLNSGIGAKHTPANSDGVSVCSNKVEDSFKKKSNKVEDATKWIHEHPLVGRDSEMSDLEKNVVTALSKDYQVISVWGIAGIGKSALVKNMFCDWIRKGTLFETHGWVDVSHPFNLWDFSRVLLSSFCSEYLQVREIGDLCTMGRTNPIVECREIMKRHKCLIVIDGLLSAKEWDLIQADLVSGSHRHNIIIIVTTDLEIATHCRGDKGELMFNVKGLEADTAIELFTKISNKAEDQEQRELTSICGGIPKVIAEIARSFARSTYRWKHTLSTSNKFILELENNKEFDRLRGLFRWMNSYFRNCPDSLKPIILYLPIFPRSQIIRRRRLVRRWIAEGYSWDSQEESAEMNGEKQFIDLLNLSVIQPPYALGLGDTRMVFCQVNGFFREYIVSRQMEENLVFELRGTCALSTNRTGRHLVISESWDRDKSVFMSIDFSHLRSLTVFGKWKPFFISESMQLVRVLDLEGALEVQYADLKKILKVMCRLKFLSLRGCHEICHLPSSIGDLKQLQTLDVRHTSIVNLPLNIHKLEKLQYIRVGTTASYLVSQLPSYSGGSHLVGVEVHQGIRKLTALHTLGVVDVSASGRKDILKVLNMLTHLHKLGVSGINKNNCNKFFRAIQDLVHLESLSLRLEDINEDCLDSIKLPLESLRSLKLHGLGNRLPKWSGELTMLSKIDLEIAKLVEGVSPGSEGPKECLLRFLNDLPRLCVLHLHVKQIDHLNVSVFNFGIEEYTFESIRIFEISFSSSPISSSSSSSGITFGIKTMQKLEQVKFNCSNGWLLFGLENLPVLKEVLLKGSSRNDDVLKNDLMIKLEQHPKKRKPVMKLDELLSSS